MNTPNKDQKVKHSIKDINNSDSIADILAYIAIDDRKDVVDAAKLRCAEIDVNFEMQGPEKQGPGSGVQGPGGDMKQGQVGTITQTAATAPTPLPDVKMTTKAAAKTSVITIRDGKAVTVEFDEKGKEIT